MGALMRYWSIRFRGSPWAKFPQTFACLPGELQLLSGVHFYRFFPDCHLSGNSHSLGWEASVLIKTIPTRNLPRSLTRNRTWVKTNEWLRDPTVDLWIHMVKDTGSVPTGCHRLTGEPSFYILFRDSWPISSILQCQPLLEFWPN